MYKLIAMIGVVTSHSTTALIYWFGFLLIISGRGGNKGGVDFTF